MGVVRRLVGQLTAQVCECLCCGMREDGLWTEGVVAPLVGRGEGTVLGRERQHAGDVLGRHKVVGNLDARAEVEHLRGMDALWSRHRGSRLWAARRA